MPAKKIPIRMCLGCSEHFPKKELIRVVRSPQGEISLDLTGKKSGRGAYICRNMDCLVKALKTKRIERTLDVPLTEAVQQALREAMEYGTE